MSSKNHQNLLQFFSKSAIKKSFTCLLIILTICPQKSTQQSTVTATCTYSYNQQTGDYSCRLLDAAISNPTDILEITGIHLQGKTDADVLAVNYQGFSFAYFNGEVLRKFVNLKSLNFASTNLVGIGENAFEFCPHLEQLTTGLFRITTFPPEMLKNCENLRIFFADGDNIGEVPENLFGNTKNLEEFRLFNNPIKSLPVNLLKNMEKLKIFIASNNLLKNLTVNLSTSAANLEEIDVHNNLLDNEENVKNNLNGLTNLTKLLLHENEIPNFDFTFFEKFQKLKELSVGPSFLASLTKISWQSLPSTLISLRVDGIGEELPENPFNQLTKLTMLRISGEGIKSLHKDIFKSLTELTVISIQYTAIKTLDPTIFMNQVALTDLNLRYNKIEELPAGIFATLVNIGNGNLHGIKMTLNNIKRLNKNSFGLHPYLRYIDFSANMIDEIERGIFSQFHSNLTANFNTNICISDLFTNVVNLDNARVFELCFNNWAGITTTTTTTSTEATLTTTPGGCGINFKKFEISFIIFVGFIKFLMNFVK